MSREREQSKQSAGGDPLRDDRLLDLEKKIDEARRRRDMPLDSKLGDPGWEERAADGRFDLPDEDDE